MPRDTVDSVPTLPGTRGAGAGAGGRNNRHTGRSIGTGGNSNSNNNNVRRLLPVPNMINNSTTLKHISAAASSSTTVTAAATTATTTASVVPKQPRTTTTATGSSRPITTTTTTSSSSNNNNDITMSISSREYRNLLSRIRRLQNELETKERLHDSMMQAKQDEMDQLQMELDRYKQQQQQQQHEKEQRTCSRIHDLKVQVQTLQTALLTQQQQYDKSSEVSFPDLSFATFDDNKQMQAVLRKMAVQEYIAKLSQQQQQVVVVAVVPSEQEQQREQTNTSSVSHPPPLPVNTATTANNNNIYNNSSAAAAAAAVAMNNNIDQTRPKTKNDDDAHFYSEKILQEIAFDNDVDTDDDSNHSVNPTREQQCKADHHDVIPFYNNEILQGIAGGDDSREGHTDQDDGPIMFHDDGDHDDDSNQYANPTEYDDAVIPFYRDDILQEIVVDDCDECTGATNQEGGAKRPTTTKTDDDTTPLFYKEEILQEIEGDNHTASVAIANESTTGSSLMGPTVASTAAIKDSGYCKHIITGDTSSQSGSRRKNVPKGVGQDQRLCRDCQQQRMQAPSLAVNNNNNDNTVVINPHRSKFIWCNNCAFNEGEFCCEQCQHVYCYNCQHNIDNECTPPTADEERLSSVWLELSRELVLAKQNEERVGISMDC